MLSNDLEKLMQIAGLAIIITFIGIVLKSAGKDSEAKMVSLIGLIITIIITVTYILEFFESVQTMVTF